MPETCPDCGRPRVTREAPTSGGCLRSLTNDGGSILSHYSDAECYRLALARVKEERDRATAECEKLAARAGELHRDLTNAQDERDRLQRERDEARRSKEFTDQWYACRFERLRKELDDKGEIGAKAYHAIVANGVGPGPEYEPPTYAQQLNTAIYRADAAEARASSLEKQLSEAQAQLAKVEAREAEGVRVFDKLVADLRAQNATQRESVATAMRAEREARAQVEQRDAAIRWALGEAPLADGRWFDERAFGFPVNGRTPPYWWRTFLRLYSGIADAAPAQEQPRAAPSESPVGQPKEGGEL